MREPCGHGLFDRERQHVGRRYAERLHHCGFSRRVGARTTVQHREFMRLRVLHELFPHVPCSRRQFAAEHHQERLRASGDAHGDFWFRGQHLRAGAVEGDQAAFQHRVGQVDQRVAPRRDHDGVTAAFDVGERQRFRFVDADGARLHQAARGFRDGFGRFRIQPHRYPVDRAAPQGGDAVFALARFHRQHAHVRRLAGVVEDLGGAQEFAARAQRQQAAGHIGEQQRVDQPDLVFRRLAHEREAYAVVAQAFDEVIDAQRLLDVGLAVRILPNAELVDRGDQFFAPGSELGYALFELVWHAASTLASKAIIAGPASFSSTILRRPRAPCLIFISLTGSLNH